MLASIAIFRPKQLSNFCSLMEFGAFSINNFVKPYRIKKINNSQALLNLSKFNKLMKRLFKYQFLTFIPITTARFAEEFALLNATRKSQGIGFQHTFPALQPLYMKNRPNESTRANESTRPNSRCLNSIRKIILYLKKIFRPNIFIKFNNHLNFDYSGNKPR